MKLFDNPESPDFYRGQLKTLEYLIGVAKETQGADVWRALFSEAWARTKEQLKALEAVK